ncbi:MAG: hypothetical protein HYU41_07845 [Candidatus Rokubacteria bacterium]|nr:hypothetical protein [Candidatus Rokubacteria bacterium]
MTARATPTHVDAVTMSLALGIIAFVLAVMAVRRALKRRALRASSTTGDTGTNHQRSRKAS